MPKALVTGVTGRLGPNVARKLIADGWSVRGLAMKDDPGRSKLDGLGIELYDGDLRDARSLFDAVAGCDHVVHCAALMETIPNDDVMTYFDINTRGTFALLQAAANQRVQRFVYLSTTSIYDVWTPHEMPIREDTERNPTHLYGTTKIANEALCRVALSRRELPVVILRPNWIMTPQEFITNTFSVNWVIGAMMKGLKDSRCAMYVPNAGEPWEELAAKFPDRTTPAIARDSGGNPWQYHCVDVRDVVDAVLVCLRHPGAVGQDFNIAAPEPMPFDAVAPAIASATGKTAVEIQTPSAFRFEFSTAKIACVLGWKPQYGYRRMIADGLKMQAGENIGVIRHGI
jgi:nucleoside-diphosphate-sugar epimerase